MKYKKILVFLFLSSVFLYPLKPVFAWPAVLTGHTYVKDPSKGNLILIDGVKIAVTDRGAPPICKNSKFLTMTSASNAPPLTKTVTGKYQNCNLTTQGWSNDPGRYFFSSTGACPGHDPGNSSLFSVNNPWLFKEYKEEIQGNVSYFRPMCYTSSDMHYTDENTPPATLPIDTADCGLDCYCAVGRPGIDPAEHLVYVFFPNNYPGLPQSIKDKGYTHLSGAWEGTGNGVDSINCSENNPVQLRCDITIRNGDTATLDFTFVPDVPPPTSTPTVTPTATPSPTPIPCGAPCFGPPNQIDEQCIDDCPICAPGPDPRQKICQGVTTTPTATPTATPTPTPPLRCGDRCINPPDCPQDCPYCEGPAGNKVCVGPSATPTPTPTINQAACQCDSISYTGTFAPGSLMTFYIKTKVENPDTYRAKVLDVVYHLKINDVEKTQIDPPIPAKVDATYMERKTVNGVPTDFYLTAWTYQLPSNLSGINYFKVYADPSSDIHCGWRTSQQIYPAVMVLGESTRATADSNTGFFASILTFLRTLLGAGSTLTPQSAPVPTPTLTPSPTLNPIPTTIVPTGVRSLQLGTFGPWGITKRECTVMEFWINYDWEEESE